LELEKKAKKKNNNKRLNNNKYKPRNEGIKNKKTPSQTDNNLKSTGRKKKLYKNFVF
jgi:hypothetical protein